MLPSGYTEVVLVEKENPHKTIHFSLSLEEGGGTHKALHLRGHINGKQLLGFQSVASSVV